jgi:hypothetical protein
VPEIVLFPSRFRLGLWGTEVLSVRSQLICLTAVTTATGWSSRDSVRTKVAICLNGASLCTIVVKSQLINDSKISGMYMNYTIDVQHRCTYVCIASSLVLSMLFTVPTFPVRRRFLCTQHTLFQLLPRRIKTPGSTRTSPDFRRVWDLPGLLCAGTRPNLCVTQ